MSDHERDVEAREVYDRTADSFVDFAGTTLGPDTEDAIDIGVLIGFARLVESDPGHPVIDAGCGPGRVAAFLDDLGHEVIGIDMSSEMIAVARRAHPGLRFDVGFLHDLPMGERTSSGIVSWYSVIHTPPDVLLEVFTEFSRVLRPRGWVLVAFQTGSGQAIRRDDAHGSGRSMISFRHSMQSVRVALETAGFRVHAVTTREACLSHETTPQGFVVAQVDTPRVPRRA